MNIKKKCAICGETFRTGNGKALYCSPECKREAHRRAMVKYRQKKNRIVEKTSN